MAEFRSEQRERLGRTVATDKTGSKQLKGFVDNRNTNVLQWKVLGNPIQFFNVHGGTTGTITGPAGETATICTQNSVDLDTNDSLALSNGTGTGTADWKNWLKDTGTGNAATQCHVINRLFGGDGGTSGGNIHPGSQKLNGNHKNGMEQIVKDRHADMKANRPGNSLTFTCNFTGFPTAALTSGQTIADPTISGTLTETGPMPLTVPVPALPNVPLGYGMNVP